MSRVRFGYVDTAEGQVHYRRIRGDGPILVFLHQTASSSAMWQAVMQRLAGDFDMIALDTPGFGGSYDPAEVPAIGYYAGVMREALDGLGVDRYHLCGHHTGVCIAVELAVENPERVLSLGMIGPVQLTQEERDEFRKHFSTPFAPTADGAYLKQTFDYLGGLGADGTLALHHRETVDTLRAWRGRVQAYNAVWDQDFPALLARLRCPMLMMAAKDDVLWPYLERAATAHPEARVAVLGGSNFEPDLDPDGTAAALRDFLTSPEAR
ncbi:alpha/beta hydrolase [Algiphilus sp.]|uniref:alpha/beta fold hydrolase n=1 Tax=Algiphilus sp. TaxID=1872431 RepID=UPI0032F05355